MENIIKEEWREVEEFPNYLVSNTGKIYSKFFKREMSLRKNNGYTIVRLSHNDKKIERTVSRLVAIAFIPNLQNKKEVNHIDENKDNNHVSNLEWVTPSENVNHGTRNKRIQEKIGYKVYQYTLNGEFIKRYPSTSCLNQIGFNSSMISKVCRGIYSQHKGYKWSYKKLH